MIRTKHPILLGGLIETALCAAAVAVGVLAGWSDGAIGSVFLGALTLGTVILSHLIMTNWEYGGPSRR